MKNCELCGGAARMHCESDQAHLCWDCDRKVHSANFLVAKHSRSLLCHVCYRPTSWLASGPNLTPAVSVCESCVNTHCKNQEGAHELEEEFEADEDSDEYEDDEEEEEADSDEEEDEDGENQVVPWSADSSAPSPPVMSCASSSGEEEVASGGGGFGLKGMRENPGFYSDDDIGCSSSQMGFGGASSSMESSRPLKQPRLSEVNQSDRAQETESTRSTAVIRSLQRLQKHMITNDSDASATVLGICRLSRDQSL